MSTSLEALATDELRREAANWLRLQELYHLLVAETVAAATVALTDSPASLTIVRGSTGTVTIMATPTGLLTGSVTFACGAAPQHTTCMFNPSTLTFAASSAPQTTTLTFATNTAALELPHNPFSHTRGIAEAVAAWLFLPLGLMGLTRRRRGGLTSRMGLLLLLILASVGLAGLSGCGSSGAFNSTNAGTYSVPVTATVNGGTTSLTLTVVVQ